MPTSAAGDTGPHRPRSLAGFTLLELMLVIAIVAVVVAGVSFALPDPHHTALAREADRMAALLDAARTRSQASGVPVRFRTTDQGFSFDGLPAGSLPSEWSSAVVRPAEPTELTLGPDPIIGPQQLRLVTAASERRILVVRTDGVRPFVVLPPEEGVAAARR
jgi:general secretion pathway protein H